MNGTSLFSNIGVAEFLLEEENIYIKVANELEQKRANIFSHFYPNTNMIVGDILDDNVFNEIISKSIENNCKFLIATPPCQGMSVAGKRDYENDPRNSLVKRVFDYIKIIKPDFIILENVEKQLNTKIIYNDKLLTILDHLEDLFSSEYNFNKEKIVNCKDYGVPQNRKRAIILMSKTHQWEFPKKDLIEVSLRDTIGHLPSLSPFVKEDFKGDNKEFWEFHPYHYPPIHAKRHIEAMQHTPTGKSAFENEFYYPKKVDGTKVKGFETTYKRMEWDKIAPTITTANGVLSSQCNVHPGDLQSNGLYNNPRVLSIYEIMLLMTIPAIINLPPNFNENLIRKTIGEGIPPLLIKKIVRQINF
ncbi:MAG: DNA cytosine methyltransferase [Cetobacterium sp.]